MMNTHDARAISTSLALARAGRAALLALFALSAACDRATGTPSTPLPASAPAPTSASASAPSPSSVPLAASASPKARAAAVAPSFPSGEHPYADMARVVGTVRAVPVRGRIIVEEGPVDVRASTPLREISQKEMPNAAFEAFLLTTDGAEIQRLGGAKSDSEGYVEASFPIPEGAARPGRYLVDIRVNGAFAGRTKALLLAESSSGAVVRSDIDLTYLDTNFLRKRDMLALVAQSAAERKTLPAMEKVYQALRAGASGNEERPLVFISGSPRFFKRVLEARMDVDGVEEDGVYLKAMDDIAESKALLLQVERIVPSLKEQVGYKLRHLFRERLDLPPKAEEILMGDDSEADFVVYSMYHRMMGGELDDDGAKRELSRAGVDAAEHAEILAMGAKARASLGAGAASPVKAIYINLTGKPNAKLKVADWPVPAKERAHAGAWPLILDLYEEGLVAKESIGVVKARLRELGTSDEALEAAAKAGVASGFLKPESLALP